jgi:hypothetical protein
LNSYYGNIEKEHRNADGAAHSMLESPGFTENRIRHVHRLVSGNVRAGRARDARGWRGFQQQNRKRRPRDRGSTHRRANKCPSRH